MRPIITLTTDFGSADTFVGAMKGVILGIAQDAEVVDLTHAVPPQDVVAGALALESAFAVFPPGTIHVIVVDPGVGTSRRAIAVETDRYRFVGPDNGVLTAALAHEIVRAAVELSNALYHRLPTSATFHGRDIFAPAAGHLAVGVPISELGPPVEAFAQLQMPTPVRCGGSLEAHVIHVDRFGNLVTDLTAPGLVEWIVGAHPLRETAAVQPSKDIRVTCGDAGTVLRGLRNAYGDVKSGSPLAYFGSGGRLEIGVRNGHAASALGLAVGSIIVLDLGR